MTDQPTEPNEADDAELIRLYAEQDDHDALGLLFQRHGEFAYRMALRVVRNPSEAEEAVQAAFVDVMRLAATYRGGAGARVWLMKIVITRCKRDILRAIRRRNREKNYHEDRADTVASESNTMTDTLARVKHALGQLPEKYRLPVWLHHYEGLPFHEVAAVLSAREATVRSHASRGLVKLRQVLTKTGMAVPALALPEMLPNLPPDPTPPGLLDSLVSLAAEGSGTTVGGGSSADTRMAARGLRTAPAGLRTLTLGALALGAVGLCGGLLYFASQDKPASPQEEDISPARATHGLLLSWDFNAPELPPELTVAQGSWRHVAGAGRDGSGCLETTSPLFQLEICEEIMAHPGPFRVSYRVRPTPSVFEHSSTKFSIWYPYDRLAIFLDLGESLSYAPGARPWMTMTDYVCEEWVDQWQEDRLGLRRQSLFHLKKNKDSRLRIMMRGSHLLDWLEIRSVHPDEVPDLAPYVRALDAIPPEERQGTIPLPSLKPGTPKGQVKVRFLDMDPIPGPYDSER